MSARKEFNRTLTALAREAGAYDTLLARWDLVSAQREAGVTPKVALTAILGDDMPATVAAPKTVAAADIVENRPASDGTLAERLRKWAGFANTRKVETPVDQFPCGGAYVTVYVDGRTKVARSLVEAGFTRTGTGQYRLYFSAGNGGASADAAFERAAFMAKRVETNLAIFGAEDAQVYASTWLD